MLLRFLPMTRFCPYRFARFRCRAMRAPAATIFTDAHAPLFYATAADGARRKRFARRVRTRILIHSFSLPLAAFCRVIFSLLSLLFH